MAIGTPSEYNDEIQNICDIFIEHLKGQITDTQIKLILNYPENLDGVSVFNYFMQDGGFSELTSEQVKIINNPTNFKKLQESFKEMDNLFKESVELIINCD